MDTITKAFTLALIALLLIPFSFAVEYNELGANPSIQGVDQQTAALISTVEGNSQKIDQIIQALTVVLNNQTALNDSLQESNSGLVSQIILYVVVIQVFFNILVISLLFYLRSKQKF